MASLYCLSLFLFFTLSSSSSHHDPPTPKPSLSPTTAVSRIQQACKATCFPQQCETSLAQLPQNPTSLQLLQSAISLSSDNLLKAQSMVKSILNSSTSSRNRTLAATSCIEFLTNSQHRISLATDALPRGRTKDARAWLSAALSYQYECESRLKNANDTLAVGEAMSFIDSLTGLSCNALAIAFSYDVFGNDTASWKPPATERNGLWEASSGSEAGSCTNRGIPPKLTPNVTVCKGGANGCYKTVQEAVNSAPDKVDGQRFVIYIKEGVYEETVRVPLEKRNVVFLGDGIGKTVITGSANAGQPEMTTYNSATVAVLGDGFMAKNLTVQNTAGSNQAVAFRLDSDLSVIENCEFIGNQDTLYAHSLRQFYKSCRIIGNVDFIFGNSAAYFEDCQILIRPRQLNPEKGESNAITAHGRTHPGQTTGFVFQNCLINGTEDYIALYRSNPKVHNSYLGRPWKEYSRTVFIHSVLEQLIAPEGWLSWGGDSTLKTLYYGEFENTGAGADLSRRVSWSSKVPAEHVSMYSAQNFIQGGDWIPSSQCRID